jgi:hypothetical protein
LRRGTAKRERRTITAFGPVSHTKGTCSIVGKQTSGMPQDVDDPHWKVLLAGLTQHRGLIEKLSAESHGVEATDVFAEAYLHLATVEVLKYIAARRSSSAGSGT